MRSNLPRRPRPFHLLDGRADRQPTTRPLDAAGRERVAENAGLAYHYAWRASQHFARDIPWDDVRAEALYALTYAASRYDPDRGVPFAAYATMVMRQRLGVMVTLWRRARRFLGRLPRADRDDAGPWEAEARPGPDAPTTTATHDFCDRVRDLLPPRWYLILRLHHMEGQTLEEIGTRFGVSRQRISEMVVQATERVRERFPEWMGN